MFEVGFTEIVLIVGLALLVLGPEKLPGLVSKVGRWTGRARSMARQLRTQLEYEVNLEEMANSRPMQSGPAPQPMADAPKYDEHFQPSSTPDPDPAVAPASEPAAAAEAYRPNLDKPSK